MAEFAQRILSDDRIAVEPARVHAVLVDPTRLAALTPLIDTIEARGDRWRWQLVGIRALGISAAPAFTTLMDVDERRIAFRPAPDTAERATATGFLAVDPDGPDHTLVAIDLVATVELPLPRAARRGVTSVMYSTMRAGGTRFAENLRAHLGGPAHRGLHIRRGDAAATG